MTAKKDKTIEISMDILCGKEKTLQESMMSRHRTKGN